MTVHLGVYALGAADEGERALVEAHLPSCPQCRAELAALAPLPGLLDRVPAQMLSGRQRAPRRTWRPAVAVTAAAAAGLAAGFWLAPRGSHPAAPSLTLSAANPATDVRATAALTATSWGTSIELRVRGVPLNQPCRLIVRSRSGGTEVTGFWDAWATGPVTVPASAAWLPSDITSLQIATRSKSLVTITAPRAG